MSIAVPSALLSIFGSRSGVLAGCVQYPSQLHQFWPVELPCFDRGAPGCRQADDKLEPFIPGEVFLPALSATMKQINKPMRHGIA